MGARIFSLLLAVGFISWPLVVQSQTTGLELARASQCLGCHQVDRKRVGPAFSVIADRYAGQPGIQDYLTASIRNGGRGRWGAIPMPAQPQVSAAQAEAIAAWILSLAADKQLNP